MFFEAAQGLAFRVLRGVDRRRSGDRLNYAFELTLGREPIGTGS